MSCVFDSDHCAGPSSLIHHAVVGGLRRDGPPVRLSYRYPNRWKRATGRTPSFVEETPVRKAGIVPITAPVERVPQPRRGALLRSYAKSIRSVTSLERANPIPTIMTTRAAPRPTINSVIMLPSSVCVCSHLDNTKARFPSRSRAFTDQNSIRIPMAFTARSQRVRCGRVPIAFSDMVHCALSRRTGLLGIAPVVITSAPAPACSASPDRTKARCRPASSLRDDSEMVPRRSMSHVANVA